MRPFAGGEIDVLVSTTVIEVGVDVANATTMVLLDADRFGICQLHQMRGRVGRGGLPGLCLLVSHAEAGSPARERLDAVAATTDGFELSRLDLDQRREGDVLGASQSGVQVEPDHAPRCCATRTPSWPRARPRPPSSSATPSSRRLPRWPGRWRSWSNHGSLTSWRRLTSPRASPDVLGHDSGARRLEQGIPEVT